MQPTIYLFFQGTCLEAMRHYADVLGGEVGAIFRNSDSPDPAHRMEGPDDLVMNMSITLGAVRVMGSDAPAEHYTQPQGFRVQIETPSRAEFDRVFDALAGDGANVEMPPASAFWAERFTMFTDRFGTPWMLNFEGSPAQA